MPTRALAHTPAGRGRVLVVDDDATVAATAARVLRRDYDVTVALNVEDAAREIERAHFDAVLCDIGMPHGGGFAVWQSTLRTDLRLSRRVVFMTGDTSRALQVDTLPNRVLAKPFTVTELRVTIAQEVALG